MQIVDEYILVKRVRSGVTDKGQQWQAIDLLSKTGGEFSMSIPGADVTSVETLKPYKMVADVQVRVFQGKVSIQALALNFGPVK
ncbi:MAG: hypothetical protein VB089_08710 [Anaerolineaceae bacterium]|nr:hypothetical protein [Anaerolineaceae bacterium]